MKKWTVMAYLAGNNNLSEDMISALRGMQRVMRSEDSDKEISLVAIYDSGYPTAQITAYSFTSEKCSIKLTCPLCFSHATCLSGGNRSNISIPTISQN